MNPIFTRRSCRRFLNAKVEPEKVEAILRAAMQAPSAVNQQPWHFILIENPETLYQLSLTSRGAKLLADAPMAIHFVMDQQDTMRAPLMAPQDMAACIQNALLEAVNQELGAVWIGVYPHEDRIETVRDILHIDAPYVPFGHIALGYPEDKQVNQFVDRFDASRIKKETFK